MSDARDTWPAEQRKPRDGPLLQSINDNLEEEVSSTASSSHHSLRNILPSKDAGTSNADEQSEEEDGEDETTSSSGSEDSGDDSMADSGVSSSEEEELSGEGSRTTPFTTDAVQKSNLRSRLQTFLPQLQQANAELDSGEDSHDKRLDEVPDNAEHYIEMDLGLGVLSEQEDEAGEVRIPQSKEEEGYGNNAGAHEIKLERTNGDSPTLNSVSKRKIEELG